MARAVGWSMTLEQLARRMRCSQCGKKGAEVIAVADQGVVPKTGLARLIRVLIHTFGLQVSAV
ncbi:MAG: hypothetical protein E6K23_17155 [Gammaproteobacteria bacterium]|nr:MAG: hypothetical protein E6K23_17155 [Gammaproteobacteria bacterium]